MDINIVNAILQLCSEQQTCLFEVPMLCNYCLEQRICSNSKYILASIKNYMEIFKISRNQNIIEFFMPFEICRNPFRDGLCQANGDKCPNLHVCYDYFCTNSCRRSPHCPYPHILTEIHHSYVLKTLVSLNLDILTRAFRVYCQSKKHSFNYNSSSNSSNRGQSSIPTPPVSKYPTSSSTNILRSSVTKNIIVNLSWKANNQTIINPLIPTKQQTKTSIGEKGLQIYWKPEKDVPKHFIEIVFSNSVKSNGGSIKSNTIYQHLGIAQVFYEDPDITDRVVEHGSATFQSFTFIPRLLQRKLDLRHVCFLNLRMETNRIPLYIDTVSKPYKKHHFEYYQNDKEIIIVEYNEDIDFSRISSNVRSYPECNGLPVKCIQLYHPETLLIEYDREYSECDIKKLFNTERIFHIKTYTFCAFVHFYCHDDLARSIKTSFDDPIRMTPIYIDIYSQNHLENCLQQHKIKSHSNSLSNESWPVSSTDSIDTEEMQHFDEAINALLELEHLVPSTPPTPPINQSSEIPPPESITEEIYPSSPPVPLAIIDAPHSKFESMSNHDETDSENDGEYLENQTNETPTSDDDFEDIPSGFDNDDLFLDESLYEHGDLEFLRSTTKNLMSSLVDMEEASTSIDKMDEPQSILYGDDYVITIKCRRFALAFLDYTEFRIEKQRNPERYRLMSSLKKNILKNKNQSEAKPQDDASLSISTIDPDLLLTLETKSNKKKRNRRNKKKRFLNNHEHNNGDKSEATTESVHEEDGDDNTAHAVTNQVVTKNVSSAQRLPHVYLDDDLKPCIVVAGEEHNEETEQETNQHGDWHNITAGGKQVLVSKKPKNQKQPPKNSPVQKSTPSNVPTTANNQFNPQIMADNAIIIPLNCRGFVHNPKLYETFRLRLRRSFASINIRFQLDTYTITIDGNNKSTIPACLPYLKSINSYKRSIFISYDNFPLTTISNIVRMQQSTAQIKLDTKADYNRIFRSTYRLIDYQLKQQYNQQQCIYCRRSKKKFQITYLEFPGEKQSVKELKDSIEQKVANLLNTRFSYVAIALSADLMTTERWAKFYKNLSQHREVNKSLLIRRINSIIQIYGLNSNIQQIQSLITKFLDANRYETDMIRKDQNSEAYLIFKPEFEEMQRLEIFREVELRFIYRYRRRILIIQCFQEKFEQVKSRIEKIRSQLSTMVLPVKSPILIRHYSRTNEIQRIATASTCLITLEPRVDQSRPNDYLVNLKIMGRSSEKTAIAQKLIKEFEEHKYSTKKIIKNEISLFTKDDIDILDDMSNKCNVSCKINQPDHLIELEGLLADFLQIENKIDVLCLNVAQRSINDLKSSVQWIYSDTASKRSIAYDETLRLQLEKLYLEECKKPIVLRDGLGNMREFDLGKMIEIINGKTLRIDRRDLQNHNSIQVPTYWSPMTKTWDKVFLAKRESSTEWRSNSEIQKLLRLQDMLPESWIIEVYRIQNRPMYQQYAAFREAFAARCQGNNERSLYRLVKADVIDEICAKGFSHVHTDDAFSRIGHGCHFYSKAKDIAQTAALLAQKQQISPIPLQHQTPLKPLVNYMLVCRVLVGRCASSDGSIKTCPPGYDSLVDNAGSPEIFVPCKESQVLPEYLIAYQNVF